MRVSVPFGTVNGGMCLLPPEKVSTTTPLCVWLRLSERSTEVGVSTTAPSETYRLTEGGGNLSPGADSLLRRHGYEGGFGDVRQKLVFKSPV